MSDNIYERIHTTLTWKRIVGFNIALFVVLIVPISVRLAQEDTENRSSAAEEAPVIVPPPNYPSEAPKIERVSAFFGKTGDTIVIFGSNFGEYQWGSEVYVGSVLAPAEGVVRWSDKVIEVKIPDGARTGQVYVKINAREARWDGSLLLYDVARAGGQVGITKISGTSGRVYAQSAPGVSSGMIELSYASEPLNIGGLAGVEITSQELGLDSLGKKIKVNFVSRIPFSSTKNEFLEFSYPGIGSVEIIRAELYDTSGRLISVFSDPLSVKLIP